MNQFDKNKIISLNIHDPQQIKAALIHYQTLLNDGSAFNEQQFDVEFKHQTPDELRRLQVNDAGENLALLKAALNLGQEGGAHNYKDEITDNRELYISEVILFAAALQYPEIKDTVVDSAKAIVAYSRRMNDTSDMWLDDMRVFGIEALYMLAKTDLQYAYLIGQYLIPYWDNEHAGQYEGYLSTLLDEHGWHPELIKAFIWCDSPEFRLGMFGAHFHSGGLSHQPLGAYLEENPEQYAVFKRLVIERFQAEPVLLQHIDETSDEEEDLSTYSPVVWLYQSLFQRPDLDDQEDALDAFMQQAFMGSTLEDEAYDLQRQVQSQVTGALVKAADAALEKRAQYQAYLARDARKYELNYGTEILKPLILAMPQGERLWCYIESGEQRDALAALEEIALMPLAKAHAPEMAAHLDDMLHRFEYNNQGIAEEIDDVLRLVSGDLLTDHFGEECTFELADNLTTTLTVTPDSQVSLLEARQQQYLRVIDVFYRALGKREFSEYMMTLLSEGEGALLTRQEYYRRYSQLPAPEVLEQSETDPVLAQEVQYIFCKFSDRDEILYKKHFNLVGSVLRGSRDLCHPRHWPKADMGFLALASYQLYRDFNERIGDEISKSLLAYLTEHQVWDKAVSKILKHANKEGDFHSLDDKGLSEADVARIRAYFTANNPEDDQASIMALLEPQLHRDDCCRGQLYLNKYSEQQKGYLLFSDHDDDFQRFTLIAYWLRQLPFLYSVHADRLWQFIIALAPVRVARNILRAYSDDSWSIEFNNVLEGIEIQEQLEKAGIDAGVLMAYEMSREFYNNERYLHWLELYSEISSTATGMFAGIDRKKAEAMHQGLQYINERIKVDFLHHASLKYPQIPLDIKHDLKRALRILVQLNITSWEQALAHEYGQACLYSGEGDKAPAKLRNPIVADEHTLHDRPCHVDGMSWLEITVLQQRGDKNHILMADQEMPLELYQGRWPCGSLLIFDQEVDSQALLARIATLQDTNARIELLVEQILAYLEGEVEYDNIASLYGGQMAGEYFRPNADESSMYNIGQFIWMLEPVQRDRLAKLLFNHDYRGFKVIERDYEKCWLHHLLLQGEIDFDSYLELTRASNLDNESTEEGMRFMLQWLVSLQVNAAHITLFCIKRAHLEVCCEFIHGHARGEYGNFKHTLAYLHAGRRAQLPEILSQADDGAELILPLSKDRSRVVKEALAKYFS